MEVRSVQTSSHQHCTHRPWNCRLTHTASRFILSSSASNMHLLFPSRELVERAHSSTRNRLDSALLATSHFKRLNCYSPHISRTHPGLLSLSIEFGLALCLVVNAADSRQCSSDCSSGTSDVRRPQRWVGKQKGGAILYVGVLMCVIKVMCC
jgi:hypothetical protein